MGLVGGMGWGVNLSSDLMKCRMELFEGDYIFGVEG